MCALPFSMLIFGRSDAMSVQINKELLNKMQAEQDAYRASLLAMPPDEILKHTWEYTAREDILDAVELGVLPEIQMQALLKSPCPLADVVKEYRDMDSQNEEILAAFEEAVKPYIEPPIYRQTFQYANEHGERDAFFASRRAFEACGRAIDESVNNHFDGMHLSDGVVQDVLAKFSAERVKLVLACTLLHKEWDLRFSRANREWAKTIDTSCIDRLVEAFAKGMNLIKLFPEYCICSLSFPDSEGIKDMIKGFANLESRNILFCDLAEILAGDKPWRHTFG